MTTFNHHKKALLQAIDREWKLLWQAVEQLSPAQMTTPDAGGWSPKDNLVHLTQWLKAMLGYHLDRKPAEEVLGLPKELAENFNFQRVNEYMFEQNKNRSADDIIAELKAKYAETIARLESIPFDDLLRPRFADDPEKSPVLNWVLGNTSEHFKEHREIIEKFLK